MDKKGTDKEERELDRELLYFASRYHILTFKSVLGAKISQVTTSPDIPLFQKVLNNWKNVDPNASDCFRNRKHDKIFPI